MADEGKPQAPDYKEVLAALQRNQLLNKGSGGIPKPMLIGSMIPKGGKSGPPDFKPKDVVRMLKDINVEVEKVHQGSGGHTYITYRVPGQKNEDMGGQLPQIRVVNPERRLHAGSPKDLQNPELAGMNFIDTAGQHIGEQLPPGMFGKFIKNQQGDYYNTLDAIRNAVLWRTGQGLVPPGTAPNMPYASQNVSKVPQYDPNQLDFMHLMYENRGTQKPNNILGGTPENLWHSGQMPGRLPSIVSRQDFETGKYPDMPQAHNYNMRRKAPIQPGMDQGQQATFNDSYMRLLKLLEDSKKYIKELPPEE